MRKSTEQSQNRCRIRPLNGSVTVKRYMSSEIYRGKNKQTFVGINNNDFATVYLREACAKLSLPKRENRRTHTDNAEAKKYGGNLQAGQRKCRRFAVLSLCSVFRKFSRRSDSFLLCLVQRPGLFCKRKCACLGGAERRRLYQDRHT